MGLLDNLKDLDLSKIDASKIDEVKKHAGNATDKIDIAGIAKKVGISEDTVKKILASLKK